MKLFQKFCGCSQYCTHGANLRVDAVQEGRETTVFVNTQHVSLDTVERAFANHRITVTHPE